MANTKQERRNYRPVLCEGVTGTLMNGRTEKLADYRSRGGYDAIRKCLDMGEDKVLEVVKEANVRGRGGAGRAPS